MDWYHLVALVYFCITTPLASLGMLTIYVFVAALSPAREGPGKEQRDGEDRW